MSARKPLDSPRFTAIAVTAISATIAGASAAFWPTYQSGAFVRMSALAIALAVIVAVVSVRFRLSAPRAAIVATLAFLAAGVPLAVPTQAAFGVLPTVEGLRVFLTSTALGWKQLLTVALPAGEFEGLLVPAYFSIFVVTCVSLFAVLGAFGTRWRLAAGTGAPVVLTVAVGFGGAQVPSVFAGMFGRDSMGAAVLPVASALLGAAIIAVLAWIPRFSRTRSDAVRRRRRSWLPAIMVVVCAGGMGVAGSVVLPPTGARNVLRSSVAQPFLARALTSPLSEFRRYWQGDAPGAAMLRVSGPLAGSRIRFASLDEWDGVVFRAGEGAASGSYGLIPFRLDQSGVVGRSGYLDVVVDGYTGVWLPTVGQVEAVSFAGTPPNFYYNDSASAGAVGRALQRGDSYRVEAVVPREPTVGELRTITPAGPPAPWAAPIPDAITARVDAYASAEGTPGAKLAAVIAGVRAEGFVSHGVAQEEPPSRAGHSADRLTQLLAGPRLIGDDEQYAAAAALMARTLGFPSRVVVGFAPEVLGVSGTEIVTGADIAAWVEVDTAEYGWVTVDPVPPVRDIPAAEPDSPTAVTRPRSAVPPPEIIPDQTEAPQPLELADDAVDDPAQDAPFFELLLGFLAWSVLALAVILSPFLALVAAKAHRRSRARGRGTPLERITGAWDDFEHTVRDHGGATAPTSTRSEFARNVGGSRPLVLAAAIDRAVFSDREPGAAEVDSAWRFADELRAHLDSRLTWRERIRSAVSLRSIRTSRSGHGTTTGTR